ARRRLALVVLLSSALVFGTYLAYTVFDDWWYARFLVPVLPGIVVLAVCVVLAIASAIAGRRARVATAIVLCIGLGGWYLSVARTRQVLALRTLESRFVRAGQLARREPVNTVFIAGQQTGSIRFYAGRATLAWDAIPPGALDETIAAVRRRGHRVVIALEDGEEQRFRERFAGQRAGALDAPPIGEVAPPARVRFYEPPTR